MNNAQDLFFEALDLDVSARAEFLARACADDAALRQRVEQLLQRHEELSNFLEEPLVVLPHKGSTDQFDPDSPWRTRTFNPNSTQHPKRSARLSAPVPLPDVPGYHTVEEIARGGMGVVFKAVQIQADRTVALKMILDDETKDPGLFERFHVEAEALARLQHPHIVQIFDVGELEGTPFFSMEYCSGGSLDQYLAGKPVEPRTAASLLVQLTRAIAAAHEAKVIHRDLKPKNVLLVDVLRHDDSNATMTAPESFEQALAHAHLKVTDFGLAKKLDDASRTRTGIVMGTPAYMSPEQARGDKDLGPTTDIYSLGVLLYEFLTGRPPFNAATPVETVMQVIHNEPVPPRRWQASIPRDLETICLKCLQKDPARRYPSAQALTADLEAYLADKPITARPIGLVEKSFKWIRRHPVPAALIALLVVTLGVIQVGAVWIAVTLRDKAQTEAENARNETAKIRAEAEVARVQQEREARRERNRRELSALLDKTDSALREQDARAARAALDQADKLYAEGGFDELLAQLRRRRRDVLMLERLEEIDRVQWTFRDRRQVPDSEIDRAIGKAFADYGIVPGKTEPEEAAKIVSGSILRLRLLRSLEEWRVRNKKNVDLRAILFLADLDPFRTLIREVGYPRAKELWLAFPGKKSLPKQPAWFAVAHGQDDDLDESEQQQILLEAYSSEPDYLPLLMTMGFRGQIDNPEKSAKDRIGWNRAALALDPINAGAWNNLGVALSDAGDETAAELAYREAIRLLPTEDLFWANLANTLNGLGKGDESRNVLLDGLRRVPRSFLLRTRLGEDWFARKEYEKAATQFEAVLADNDRVPDAHAGLGDVFLARNEPSKALPHYRRAAELEPNTAHYHSQVGNLLHRLGKNKEAVLSLRKATELAVDDFNACVKLGIIYCDELHDYEEAEKWFREGLRINPEDAGMHYNLGNALKNQNDFDGAIREYELSLKYLSEPRADVHTNLGMLLRQKNRLDESLDHLLEAVRIEPNLVPARYQLGMTLLRKNDKAGAADEFEAVTRLAPKSAETQFRLTNLRRELGQYDKAEAAYKKAIPLAPTPGAKAEAYNNLAVVYLQQKRYDLGIETVNKSIEADRTYSNARATLGLLLKGKGDIEAARAALTEAAKMDKRWESLLKELPPKP